MATVLLCHFDGTSGSTSFTDASTYGHTLTPTSVTVNTAAPKFGTGCGDFTASTSARIDTGNATDFQLGAGQFTVEAWAYFTAAPSSGSVYGILTVWAGGGQSWFLGMVQGSLNLQYSTTGSDNPFVGAAYTPPLNTWTHIAADRDASNVLRVYVNGAVIASGTVSATFFASTTHCTIGNMAAPGGAFLAFPGYLDEARVVTGQAMYGGSFTPPTAPFPTSASANADGTSTAQAFSPTVHSAYYSGIFPASRSSLTSTVITEMASGTFAIPDVGLINVTVRVSETGNADGTATAAATTAATNAQRGNADGAANAAGNFPQTVSGAGAADGLAQTNGYSLTTSGEADGYATATGGGRDTAHPAAMMMGI